MKNNTELLVRVTNKHCAFCEKPFQTENVRKEYCSNTCRTYASLDRSGKLEPNIKANLLRKNKPSRSDAQIGILSDRFDSVCSHIMGHFGDLAPYPVIRQNDKGKPEPTSKQYHCCEDLTWNVQNVRRLDNDRYLVTSVNGHLIQHIATTYKGSRIFLGVSDVVETDLDPQSRQTTYNTVLSREVVISISGIPDIDL